MKLLHRGTTAMIQLTLIILVAFDLIEMRSIAIPAERKNSTNVIETEASDQIQPTKQPTILSTPTPESKSSKTTVAPTTVPTTTTKTSIQFTSVSQSPTINQPPSSPSKPVEAIATQNLPSQAQSNNATISHGTVQPTLAPSDTKAQITRTPEFNGTSDSKFQDLLSTVLNSELANALVDQGLTSTPTINVSPPKSVHNQDNQRHDHDANKEGTYLVDNLAKQPQTPSQQQQQLPKTVLRAVVHAGNVATVPSYKKLAIITRLLFCLFVQAYIAH